MTESKRAASGKSRPFIWKKVFYFDFFNLPLSCGAKIQALFVVQLPESSQA